MSVASLIFTVHGVEVEDGKSAGSTAGLHGRATATSDRVERHIRRVLGLAPPRRDSPHPLRYLRGSSVLRLIRCLSDWPESALLGGDVCYAIVDRKMKMPRSSLIDI